MNYTELCKNFAVVTVMFFCKRKFFGLYKIQYKFLHVINEILWLYNMTNLVSLSLSLSSSAVASPVMCIVHIVFSLAKRSRFWCLRLIACPLHNHVRKLNFPYHFYWIALDSYLYRPTVETSVFSLYLYIRIVLLKCTQESCSSETVKCNPRMNVRKLHLIQNVDPENVSATSSPCQNDWWLQ